MVDTLPVKKVHIVYILLLAHKLQVEDLRTVVLLLVPPEFIHQTGLQVLIPQSYHNPPLDPVFLLKIGISLLTKTGVDLILLLLLRLVFVGLVFVMHVVVVLHKLFCFEEFSQVTEVN